ncbi:hypothetical protein [Flavobacterium sp.]|uniref:hypothetical protein n=1 Tax=Flavobacterium sp. TaxID=239 RepID=UPI0037C054D1
MLKKSFPFFKAVFFITTITAKINAAKNKIVTIIWYNSLIFSNLLENPAIAGFFYIQKVTNHLLLFANPLIKNQT